jgi:hypothetical protein
MSILVVELLDCGIVFGADQNVTFKPESGAAHQETEEKVFRWPREDVLLGFVGAARIGNQPIGTWLEQRRSDYARLLKLSDMASMLRQQVEDQRRIDEGDKKAEGLIIHLGGFEPSSYGFLPQIWHVTNVLRPGLYNYLGFKKEFSHFDAFSEEMAKAKIDPSELRTLLSVKAKQLDPLWFHQGFDYPTFNVLEKAIRTAFASLCMNHPDFSWPRTLSEWESQVRFSILMYGSFFKAYHDDHSQFVGGCSALSIPWPESEPESGGGVGN